MDSCDVTCETNCDHVRHNLAPVDTDTIKNNSRAAVNSGEGIRVFYAGYMNSPFAVEDKKYLESAYTVSVFNLSEAAASFSQVPGFLVRCFTQILPGVLRSDVVWIWGADYYAVPFMIFSKLFRKKMVIALFGVEVYPPNEIGYGFQMQKVRGAVSRWLMRNADMNVPMSDAYWDMLTKLIPEAHAWTIPGCVDASLYKPNYATKEVLAVTAYCDYKLSPIVKGIPVFEKARMHSRVPMVTIHNRSHETQIETFLRAKVYCQLSFTEQFGMSLLEAMACGCVPVVSDRDGLPELVGGSGLVVPYGDADAVRRAVAVAIHLDGKRARARAEEFSVQRKVMHMHNVIRLVLNRGKRLDEILELVEAVEKP